MSRIRRGWALTKKSWGVLRENRSLVRFPLYGAAATIVCAAIVLGPGLYLIDDGKVAIGGPLAGWLSEAYDPRVALLLAAVAGLSAAWAGHVSLSRLRSRPASQKSSAKMASPRTFSTSL